MRIHLKWISLFILIDIAQELVQGFSLEWNIQTLDDDYSEAGMPVPETTTTSTTTATTVTPISSFMTAAASTTARHSPWFALPESAFPFPLIPASGPIRAVAVLEGSARIHGLIVFDQGSPNEAVIVSARLSGLNPNGISVNDPSRCPTTLNSGVHGFHIHSSGDLSKSCETAGGHYNPLNLIHGAPTDTFRHVGDLGNMIADGNGDVFFSRPDFIISLSGPFSVLGRAVVIHEQIDDFGRGSSSESHRSGNSGARLACGVIGMSAVTGSTM